MTTRKEFLLFPVLLAYGCAKAQRELGAVYPSEAAGWKLEQTRNAANEELPEPIRGAGLKQWNQASYSGPGGRLTVQLFEMNSETIAFEMVQKWHQPKSVSFYKGPLFVIVKAVEGEGAGLQEFARALQKQISF